MHEKHAYWHDKRQIGTGLTDSGATHPKEENEIYYGGAKVEIILRLPSFCKIFSFNLGIGTRAIRKIVIIR